MTKFGSAKTKVLSAVTSASQAPDALTAEGGVGFTRDAKSELFLLAVTNMVSEQTFYESGKDRDERFERLVHAVTKEDPDWIKRFVPFLRNTMNMRSASLIMAAEYVRAGGPGGRAVISSAIVRADEPAEMLGYWLSRYGRAIPQPVKRGIADAAARLYNERNAIKWDGGARGIRMADVLDLTHPKTDPARPWQPALFKYLLADRHQRDGSIDEGLRLIAANRAAIALDEAGFREAFNHEFVQRAGLTWEQASSRYGKLDAKFWEAMIPNMGIFALVRNLRNFEQAGISSGWTEAVIAELSAKHVIAKSRMFPLRFYAAYKETGTHTWSKGLESAITLSMENIPELPGRSLILVDLSGSMQSPVGGRRSKISRYEGAALFGAALALRAEQPTLVPFATSSAELRVEKPGAVLRLMDEILKRTHVLGGGTETWKAVSNHLSGHDRVIILTDEQAWHGESHEVVGERIPLYTFNLAGYRVGHAPAGTDRRVTFGGLTDQAFAAIDLLERGRDQRWPF
jgi:hypothetical protein